VPETSGSFVKDVNPGANDSGAQVVPPSVEYEIPQPSLKCQSFHIPIRIWPSGLIPSDSSLAANWSSVTWIGAVAAAAPTRPTTASTQNAAAKTTNFLTETSPFADA